MEKHVKVNEIDKVEILTLQDNYIDLTAMDNNEIIRRASPLKDGESVSTDKQVAPPA